MALASSCLGKPVPSDTAFIGEAGLGGEIRAVGRASSTLRGGGAAWIQAGRRLQTHGLKALSFPPRLEFVGVSNLREALSQTF